MQAYSRDEAGNQDVVIDTIAESFILATHVEYLLVSKPASNPFSVNSMATSCGEIIENALIEDSVRLSINTDITVDGVVVPAGESLLPHLSDWITVRTYFDYHFIFDKEFIDHVTVPTGMVEFRFSAVTENHTDILATSSLYWSW